MKLSNPKIADTARGKIIYFDPVVEVIKDINIRVPEKVMHEFNCLWNNDYKKLCEIDWWRGDEKLAGEYCDMFQQLREWDRERERERETMKMSRNMVAGNKKCCYNQFQILDKNLIVYARSTDFGKGYKWDKHMFRLIAKKFNCEKITVFWACPHYYLRGDVARRQEVKKCQ